MSNRISPTASRFSQGIAQGNAIPPPPNRGTPPHLSPRRRDHATQSPPLTTSMNIGLGPGLVDSTSSDSISSQFCKNTTYSSAGTANRGVSPMASRLSTTYNAPYNPQEWGPLSVDSSRTERQNVQGQNETRTLPDGTLVSPPPPYSPRPDMTISRTSTSSTLSPADNIFSPQSSSQPLCEASSGVNGSDERQYYSSRSSIFAPPPGPPSTHASRSSSRIALDKLRPYSPLRSSFAGPSNAPVPGPSHLVEQLIPLSPAIFETPTDDVSANIERAPASRRAYSADAYAHSNGSSRNESLSRNPDQSKKQSWEPGMPLPGPPPGPPPSASRSQSASGVGQVSSAIMLAPAPRPRARLAPSSGTLLGPVPPTPADWMEGDRTRSSPDPEPSHRPRTYEPVPSESQVELIGDSNISVEMAKGEASAVETISGPGLFRSSAMRDPSAKNIRDRRSASKSASDGTFGSLGEMAVKTNPWADAMKSVRPNSSEGPKSLPLRSEAIPLSLSARPIEELEANSGFVVTNPRVPEDESSDGRSLNSTPKAYLDQLKASPDQSAPTPPLSPNGIRKSPLLERNSLQKTLPTPPYQSSQRSIAALSRPISQVLHLDTQIVAPSVPLPVGVPVPASPLTSDFMESEKFMADSLLRHREFLQKEQLARNDEERLRIFGEFILEESRIRRRRYSKAWANGKFDVRPIREKLFEQSLPQPSRSSSSLSESTAGFTSEPPTPASSSSVHGRPESAWWNNYKPELSPIASMSNDEVSSRGRTSSRWWETRTGTDSEGGGQRVERTRRESKYMGLQRDAMQTAIPEVDSPPLRGVMDSDDQMDFPPEKEDPESFGFYDAQQDTPLFVHYSKQPEGPAKLDISRFITLPPPYPRHFPAVSNSHPGLVAYRTAVRTYSDLSELNERKARNKLSTEALQKNSLEKISASRRSFRANIQAQIDEGSITYAEAAEAESALKLDEYELEKQNVQAEYDSFQDVVLNPLHDLLNERLTKLNGCINDLQNTLLSDAQASNPDRTQEEGDEEPELLEKLTQFKWLFEAREQIHKEIFDLLTQRNNMYKAIVLLPYRQANNMEKLRSTDEFFEQDNMDRLEEFQTHVLGRHEKFLNVVENVISHGIELQSSTFWDIAPSILDLLQKIPEDLHHFVGIQIPDQEYRENESYHRHPFQYLYSLMVHAERSTYQFIESQINLHCLLHEAKNGVLSARCKTVMARNIRSGEGAGTAEEIEIFRTNEEEALTEDLRQKTAMIEQQWTESLGSQIRDTKKRIKVWLVEEGGWDDDLEQTET